MIASAGGDTESPNPGSAPTRPGEDDSFDETVEVSRRRPGPRRRGLPDDTAPDLPPDGDEPTEGSTVVAHRESRRRARGESVHEPVPVPEVAGRDARMPLPGPDDRYPVRAAAPVVVSRQPPAEHPPQVLADTAVAEARMRSRARRRVLAVVGGASVIVIAAAAAIVALALSA